MPDDTIVKRNIVIIEYVEISLKCKYEEGTLALFLNSKAMTKLRGLSI